MTICKLCGHDKPLIRAHIFPNWAYRYLKQDNHLIQLTNVVKSRKIQSGYWDSNILCRECDGDVIGKYDTYASQFFEQDFATMITVFSKLGRKDERVYHVKEFDYPKLFIFIISLFWRASITDCQAFSKVNLGPYETLARDIILAGEPMHEDLFEIAIFAAEHPAIGEKFEKAILHPFPSKFGAANCYRFALAGFDFVLKVDKRQSNLHMPGITMHPDGFNIIILPFEGSTIGKFVSGFRKKLQELRGQN